MKPKNGPRVSAISSSVAQARLDRAADPPGTYARTYVRWWNRLAREAETYPSAVLKEHLEEIQPELRTLAQLRLTPSTSLTGPEWVAIAERHDRLKARERAIEETLERREWAARRRQPRPAGKPFVTPPLPPVELENDPFAAE